MKPRKKDILDLKDWDREQFASWLRKGLEGYFIHKEGVRHFHPLEYCILQEHTLWGDLVEIYDAFPHKQQKEIREAIALLISRLPVQQNYKPVFSTLLSFAVAVGATEVLQILHSDGTGFRQLEKTDSEFQFRNELLIEELERV